MALDADLQKAIEKQIQSAKDQNLFIGTVYSVSPLQVVIDGSSVPIPCIQLQDNNLTIAKRVVVMKVGPNPIVVGGFGNRVAHFASYNGSDPTNVFTGDAWLREDLGSLFVNVNGTTKRLGPQIANAATFIGPTRPSRWYWIQHSLSHNTGALGAGARSTVFPFTVYEDKIMSGVCWEITTAGGAGSQTRFGLHKDERGQPTGGVLFDAGHVVADSTGIKGWTGLSVLIPAGNYWIEIASQGGDPTYRTINSGSGFGNLSPGMSSVGQLSQPANPRVAYRYEPRSTTLTTLPAHDDSAWTSVIPTLQMQFSSPA